MRTFFSEIVHKDRPILLQHAAVNLRGLLCNNDDSRKYRREIFWELIPQKWRLWCIDDISSMECYAGVTIEEPPAIFVDKSMDIINFIDDITSFKLYRLM